MVIVLGFAGFWILTERNIPVLDKNAAKKLIANFEKMCRTKHDAKKCKEIVGKGHTKCLLASASKNEAGEVIYSKEIYLGCLDDS